MQENLVPIQIGCVEPEILDIIDLIHMFSSSADFAGWVTDGRFQHSILYEHIDHSKYTRTYLYSLEEVVFFHGKMEICTDKLNQETIQVLTQNRAAIHATDPMFAQMKKVNISKTIATPHYTIISDIIFKESSLGLCWEIYNLRDLVKIYDQKHDPLRHWRSSRRE